MLWIKRHSKYLLHDIDIFSPLMTLSHSNFSIFSLSPKKVLCSPEIFFIFGWNWSVLVPKFHINVNNQLVSTRKTQSCFFHFQAPYYEKSCSTAEKNVHTLAKHPYVYENNREPYTFFQTVWILKWIFLWILCFFCVLNSLLFVRIYSCFYKSVWGAVKGWERDGNLRICNTFFVYDNFKFPWNDTHTHIKLICRKYT